MATLTIVSPPPPAKKYALELDENEARAVMTAIEYVGGGNDTWEAYTFSAWDLLLEAGLRAFPVVDPLVVVQACAKGDA